MPRRKFLSPEFGTKFQREVLLFLDIHEFPFKTVWKEARFAHPPWKNFQSPESIKSPAGKYTAGLSVVLEICVQRQKFRCRAAAEWAWIIHLMLPLQVETAAREPRARRVRGRAASRRSPRPRTRVMWLSPHRVRRDPKFCGSRRPVLDRSHWSYSSARPVITVDVYGFNASESCVAVGGEGRSSVSGVVRQRRQHEMATNSHQGQR